MSSDFYTKAELARKNAVMARVKTVKGTQLFFSSPILSAFFAVGFFLCACVLVSVTDVVHNIMAQVEWSDRFSYTFSSLFHSRILVQTFAYLMMASGCLVLIKSLRRLRTPIYTVGNFLVSFSPLKLFRS